jgi:ABC-type glycerol-3-phosphate transport system permease component
LAGKGKPFFIIFGAALFLAWNLGPLVWQGLTSFRPDAVMSRLPPLIPPEPTFSHYVNIFSERNFQRNILNSLVVSGGATLLSLFFGSLGAFALAKLPIRGTYLLLTGILSISMFPPVAVVGQLFLFVRSLGLMDTHLALILSYTIYTLPLMTWVLTNFFAEIPSELIDSARVDGCGNLQIFFRIVLPLSGPGLAAASILTFIFCWNEFLFALTFTASDLTRTVPPAIALFPGIHHEPWGEIAAASIVVILPLLVLAFLFQRRIVSGLTAGAVKG